MATDPQGRCCTSPRWQQHCRDTDTVRAQRLRINCSCPSPNSVTTGGASLLLSSEGSCPAGRGRGAQLKTPVPLWCSCQCKLGGFIPKAKKLIFRELGKERAATAREELPRAGHFCCLSCCFSGYGFSQNAILLLHATRWFCGAVLGLVSGGSACAGRGGGPSRELPSRCQGSARGRLRPQPQLEGRFQRLMFPSSLLAHGMGK